MRSMEKLVGSQCDVRKLQIIFGWTPKLERRQKELWDVTCGLVELCETAVCFLHIQLFGTINRLPKMHKFPPSHAPVHFVTTPCQFVCRTRNVQVSRCAPSESMSGRFNVMSFSNNFLVSSTRIFVQLTFGFSASQVHLIQKKCSHQSFPHGCQAVLRPSLCNVVHVHGQE